MHVVLVARRRHATSVLQLHIIGIRLHLRDR